MARYCVHKDITINKTMKIIPLEAHGEPIVVVLPLSLFLYLSSFTS